MADKFSDTSSGTHEDLMFSPLVAKLLSKTGVTLQSSSAKEGAEEDTVVVGGPVERNMLIMANIHKSYILFLLQLIFAINTIFTLI